MTKRAFVVTGLGYGDEGKGTITDYLCRHFEADLVVRHNGGPQAAHNVVLPDGRHHTFAQFGSGTLAGVPTYLSEHMLINPHNLFAEAEHLEELGVKDPLSMLTIDPRCKIITPFQVAANRLRETARGEDRHGSCGQGIGETMSDSGLPTTPRAYIEGLPHVEWEVRPYVLYMDALDNESLTRNILRRIRERKRKEFLPPNHTDWDLLMPLVDEDEIEGCIEIYKAFFEQVKVGTPNLPDTIVFEGGQGVLLDETYGQAPYHTWSTTTAKNALDVLMRQGNNHEVTKIGVTRTYATRHGAGPFRISNRDSLKNFNDHNVRNEWQGSFHTAPLSEKELRYAIACNGGIDAMAITCMDHFFDDRVKAMLVRVCSEPKFIITSRGPTANDKTFVDDSFEVAYS